MTLRNAMLGLGLLHSAALIFASPVWATDPNRLDNGYCKSGYVFRDSYDGDGLCVTPAQRIIAKAKAKAAAENCKTQHGTMSKGVCFF
jgi:hypothetical protein